MKRSSFDLLARLALVPLLLAAYLATPGLPAHAAPVRADEATLFRATFEGATPGPVTAPLKVETGTVVAGSGTVAVATVNSKQLVVDGANAQSTALLRWDNYPNALPGAPPPAVHVKISADLTASTTKGGASFGLLNGSSFFELLTFGPNGALTRAGEALSLPYSADEKVELEARILLPGGSDGTVQIKIATTGGQRTIVVPLPASWNASTLNQLRLRAPSGAGKASIDNVLVTFKQEELEDDDPPAAIDIDDQDVEQEIEHVGDTTFVSISITIINTGGKARNSMLVLDLDELADLDLAEVAFPLGAGFVREIRDGKLYIGIGDNNIIRNDAIKVKIKFKAHKTTIDIKVQAHFRLSYRDTSGNQEIVLAPIVIVVPVTVVANVPVGSTPPISGTVPISGTAPISGVVTLPVTQIDVRIRTTWRARGGLIVFGYPISQPISQTDGLVVQYFERARIEIHPATATQPATISYGRLAVELGYQEPPSAAGPPASASEQTWYFPATGHVIAAPFRTFWRAQGGLQVFGMPIGTTHAINGITVQYFERIRLELHEDMAGTPYLVQIGLLGVEAYTQNGPR